MNDAPQAPEARAALVSRDVAGRLIMVSAKRIDQLVNEGWIRRAGRNQYAVVDVVQGYLRFLQTGNEERKKATEDNVVMIARAREIEERIRERREHLIGADEHREIVAELLSMVRQEFDSFPEGLDPDQAAKAEAGVSDIIGRLNERAASLDEQLRTPRRRKR